MTRRGGLACTRPVVACRSFNFLEHEALGVAYRTLMSDDEPGPAVGRDGRGRASR